MAFLNIVYIVIVDSGIFELTKLSSKVTCCHLDFVRLATTDELSHHKITICQGLSCDVHAIKVKFKRSEYVFNAFITSTA